MGHFSSLLARRFDHPKKPLIGKSFSGAKYIAPMSLRGTFETCRLRQAMSGFWGKTEVIYSRRAFRILTLLGHRRSPNPFDSAANVFKGTRLGRDNCAHL
jgi:hypothetical protein